MRGRESLPFQRSYLDEHQGLVVLAVVILIALVALLYLLAH
jgi:hypothetical protein